jgi:hypothetical protein
MRGFDRYIIDFVIILQALVILTTLYISIDFAMNLLVIVVALSYLLSFFLISMKMYKKSDLKKQFLYLFLSIIAISIHAFFVNQEIKNPIIFISGLILIMYLNARGIDKRSFNILLFSSATILLAFLFQSSYTSNFDNKNFFRSVWENANMSGIAITSALFPILIGIFYKKKKIIRFYLILIALIGFYTLLLTFNRSSILSIIIFSFLVFYNKKEYRLNNLARSILILSPIIILLFFINYVIFYGDVLFLGKSIAQRPGWPILFASIINSPFEANRLPSGGLNFFIAGSIEYGIIGIILVFLFLISLKPNWNKQFISKYKYFSYLAFLSLFIQQSFENTFINGAFGIYIYSYLLIGIANSTELYNSHFHTKQ